MLPLPLIYLLLVATAFFWGGTFIAGRLLAGAVPPLCASFLRFFIATLTLFIIVRVSEGMPKSPNRHQWLPLLLLGATGVFAYNVFFFTGLAHISASRAALIVATTPLSITIVSAIICRESLPWIKVTGIVLSLTGALFVISNGQPFNLLEGGFGIGERSLIGCVLSWTAYTIIGRSVLRTMSPLQAVFYSSLFGMLLLAIPAINEGLMSVLFSITPVGWSSLAYLGICGTALGFSWYYSGIKRIGPSRAGIFINLVPVFAILQSWLLLSETLKSAVVVGGVLVLAGVYLVNRPSRGANP